MAFFYRLRYVLSVAKIRASNSEKVVSVPKPIHFMSLFLLLSFLLPIGDRGSLWGQQFELVETVEKGLRLQSN